MQISFVVKKELRDDGRSTTVKLEIPQGERFSEFAARLATTIREAQQSERSVDRETALIMRLPGPLVRSLVGFAKLLDHWNLFPRFMTANDPMFASIFLANLGSAGISEPGARDVSASRAPGSVRPRWPTAARSAPRTRRPARGAASACHRR
ncbi:MAG: hypothetical protein C0497_15115 [Gemmatimonas sp.]|nr:hypothetical protein [Gemmatimonas sp.]